MARALPLVLLAALLLAPLAAQAVQAQAMPQEPGQGPVVRLRVEGPITRATDLYIEEGLEFARREDAAALLIELDTPGGGLDETLKITERFAESRIPVIGYVSPTTAHAWSAGTIILLATHVAAMAPFTVIGSSQPVSLGEGGFTPINDSKIVNALVAKVEALAAAHGRNVTAAREFVTENLNLNADQALEAGVIEVVAPTVPEVLRQAHGREVPVPGGNLTMDTAGRRVVDFAPTLRVSVLDIFYDPLIAGLLMLVGIYSIVFGLGAPGHGAEVLGAIALLLGLVGLGFSVSIVALALIGLGALFLLMEAHTPGFGVFGGAGLIALILGTIFIAPLQPTGPFEGWSFPAVYQQQVLLVLAMPSVVFAGFLAFALFKIMEVRRRKPFIGGMEGDEAEVAGPLEPGKRGYVWYRGERWQAESDVALESGQRVLILGKEGPLLKVGPRTGTAPPPPKKDAEAAGDQGKP